MINSSYHGWRASLVALGTCLVASAGVFAASFTPGNLAVLRVGDGVQNSVSLTPSGSGYLLRFAGIPGHVYEIQRTTTLMPASWSTISTMTAPLHGIIEFEDTTPPQPSAFYRTKAP